MTQPDRLFSCRLSRLLGHHTPRLFLSFSPHLRSSISNPRRYHTFPRMDKIRPSSPPSPTTGHTWITQLVGIAASTHPHPQTAVPAPYSSRRSLVESQCRNPSPLGRYFYCLLYWALFVRFLFSFHHRPSALHSTVYLFYLSPKYRTLPRDHLSPYSCVAYLYIIPSPGLGEGVYNPM